MFLFIYNKIVWFKWRAFMEVLNNADVYCCSYYQEYSCGCDNNFETDNCGSVTCDPYYPQS